MAVQDLPRSTDEFRSRPLQRCEYDRLVAEGFFDNERIELLRGVLVEMSPQKPPHSGAVQDLAQLLIERLDRRAIVRAQLPMVVGDHSEPEPDVAVVPLGSYRVAHPTEALLVVEVALSSAAHDLGLKAGIYAEAAVPEYWVLDLPNACVHVHCKPSSLGYEEIRVARAPERLALFAFPDVVIGIDELLG